MPRNRLIFNTLLPFTVLTSQLNVWRLSIIRGIVFSLLLLACIYALKMPAVALPPSGVFLLIGGYGLVALATLYLSKSRSKSLSLESVDNSRSFDTQLSIEIVFVGLLAYQTGGATNPFISYLLVPISIAAATLPRYRAYTLTATAIAVYTLLLFYYQPFAFFASAGGEHNATMNHHQLYGNAHYLGMWFNFVVSAALITWFVLRMAETIRAQDQAINRQREAQLQDEQIVAIASMAAGTAHELGTPVNTIKLLLDDFDPNAAATVQQQDIALLRSQIEACEKSLHKLVSTARQSQPHTPEVVKLGPWLADCVSKWRPLHPETSLLIDDAVLGSNQSIKVDETLRQAMANILDNAATASPSRIELFIEAASKNAVSIIIRDFGHGLPAEFTGKPEPFAVEQKKSGLGIGVLLSNASINRLGGELSFCNRYGKNENEVTGADVSITLPLYSHTTGKNK